MDSLASLFNLQDFEVKDKKSNKEKAVSKKENKKETKKKGIRYPLPVRITNGHIRLVLTSEEFPGKSLDENTIKARIRQEYPELSGLQFNLVKFSNKYTDELEKKEKMIWEESMTNKENFPFAFAEAEAEPEPEEESEADLEDVLDSEEELETESEEDIPTLGDEMDEPEEDDEDAASNDTNSDSDQEPRSPLFEKGSWVKLDIHYQQMASGQKVTFPVKVRSGGTSISIDEEISMDEIKMEWCTIHPEYENCQFYYDDKNSFLVPFLIGQVEPMGKKYDLPIEVGYSDYVETYTSQDFDDEKKESATLKEIQELHSKRYPEYENCSFYLVEALHQLIPVIEFKKEISDSKIAVPVTVRGYGTSLTFHQEDFHGKDAVTLEEIRCMLEEIYPEFSKERTEMTFDERGFVVPILKGSKKGVQISSEQLNQNLYFVEGRDGYSHRVEQKPYGFFDCRMDGKDVGFRLNGVKIPGRFLQDILAFLKKESDKEAAAQIFYSPYEMSYEIYYPEQRGYACSVTFARNHEMEHEKILVMDIHSHGRMPAFFSGVDNRDEKGTRLFLVMGNMDKLIPTYAFRAGIAGYYKTLSLDEVFDLEGLTYEN